MGTTTDTTDETEAVDAGREAGAAEPASGARRETSREASPERRRMEDAIVHARERRITADEFQMLWQKGVFTAEDRIELLDGRLIAMSPSGPTHSHTINLLVRLLSQRLYQEEPPPALLSVQNPVRLSKTSEPEPDLAVYDASMPTDRHPTPDDLFLVVEVSDSSLDYDRVVKASRYARAGVPEYWLVDVAEQTIEVHRRPTGDDYDARVRHRSGDVVSISSLPDLDAIPVASVFPDATSPETSSSS